MIRIFVADSSTSCRPWKELFSHGENGKFTFEGVFQDRGSFEDLTPTDIVIFHSSCVSCVEIAEQLAKNITILVSGNGETQNRVRGLTEGSRVHYYREQFPNSPELKNYQCFQNNFRIFLDHLSNNPKHPSFDLLYSPPIGEFTSLDGGEIENGSSVAVPTPLSLAGEGQGVRVAEPCPLSPCTEGEGAERLRSSNNGGNSIPNVQQHGKLPNGYRPFILFFDDENNFIYKDGYFYTTKGNCPKAEAYRGVLNALNSSWRVLIPPIWISSDETVGYCSAARTLPLRWIDEHRTQISAFVIDLEWLPTNTATSDGRQTYGRLALHLLSQRYPEMPSFVYTGHFEINKLRESFLYGAAWYYEKGRSHSGADNQNSVWLLKPETLLEQLEQTIRLRHGAFPDTPYPDQLRLDPANNKHAKDFLGNFNLRPPLSGSQTGKMLQQLFARLYPAGEDVWPVEVISGKSRASGAIFAASRRGMRLASRFIKIGPWLMIRKEYDAYQQVIRPRLTSYVANIDTLPVVAEQTENNEPIEPLGALMYTMAGFPEGFENLISLDKLIERTRKTGDPEPVLSRLRYTFERVLRPLYQSAQGKRCKKPLWAWLGNVLPPAYTGVLCPLAATSETMTLSSYTLEGYKEDTAWHLAAQKLKQPQMQSRLIVVVDPWASGNPDKIVHLQGFYLSELDYGAKKEWGEVTFTHPDLGLRIWVRGSKKDVEESYGKIWGRVGIPLEGNVWLAQVNAKHEELHQLIREGALRLDLDSIERLQERFTSTATSLLGNTALSDPLAIFGTEGLPHWYTLSALEGPIHGDLNLNNILFGGEEQIGWLIDFEASQERGMLAFDLAKIEIEVANHHLFPELERLSKAMMLEKATLLDLLAGALYALDVAKEPLAVFRNFVQKRYKIGSESLNILRETEGLLRILAEVRQQGAKILDETKSLEEWHWARAAYWFTSAKFKGVHPALAYCASVWYLTQVAPTGAGEPITDLEEAAIIKLGSKACPPRQQDDFLIKITRWYRAREPKEDSTVATFSNRLACAFGATLKPPPWGENIERWDIASTGGIANITPIMGYLWLMAKAIKSKRADGEYGMVVPKISSKGGSCGTVDILKSGGAPFVADLSHVVQVCREQAGVLCEPKDLAPVDYALMARRKSINAMKSPALVYASILGKKIALGCTRAIVDIKLGMDSKIDPTKRPLSPLVTETEPVKAWLNKLGINVEPKTTVPYLEQILEQESLGTLKSIRWFATNGDTPQCRAIGRNLILFHLDGLITGKYTTTSVIEKLISDNNHLEQYFYLYRETLQKICGCEDIEWPEVQAQWKNLKKQLSTFDNMPVVHNAVSLLTPNSDKDLFDDVHQRYELSKEIDHDLALIHFAINEYNINATTGSLAVQHINAIVLDRFFEYLCGDETYDEQVGIWLHKLPGEILDTESPTLFLSVFYRPSRHAKEDIQAWGRDFLRNGVSLVIQSQSTILSPKVV